jgi:hypothetical protein
MEWLKLSRPHLRMGPKRALRDEAVLAFVSLGLWVERQDRIRSGIFIVWWLAAEKPPGDRPSEGIMCNG